MKTILILLDTVRKEELRCYNPYSNTKTPNIDDLASESIIFNNHCTGSLPCMPARRDLLTGRLDFFERFWGGIEPFDCLLTTMLQQNKIPTHIETDHHHYFNYGGEGYIQSYGSWNLYRGQESDKWINYVDDFQKPIATHGRYNQQFLYNASTFKTVEDYPTMKTFNGAIEYIKNHANDQSFFLQVEGFDPHEPFFAPQEYLDMYELNEINEHYISPKYGQLIDNKQQLEHIRKRYQANLSFADYAVGKLINALKSNGIYEECNIIFTSDHGFHLGDHGVIGKGVNHLYNEISEIPLLMKRPMQKVKKVINQFTQNIDLMPTILNDYDIAIPNNLHGKSLLPLINGTKVEWRKAIVSGYHGQSVMFKNEKYTYYQAPTIDNTPLNLYTAMPISMRGYLNLEHDFLKIDPELITMGRFLQHTNYPVFKMPIIKGISANEKISYLYENSDKKQENAINNLKVIRKIQIELIKIMEELNVPQEQFTRLNLKGVKDE